MQRFAKGPAEVLDFQVDWTTWLQGDSILTSTWTVATGLTKDSESNTATTATIWVSGGVVGNAYKLINAITTNGGRTAGRAVFMDVAEQVL
jgi:hypothetical protein